MLASPTLVGDRCYVHILVHFKIAHIDEAFKAADLAPVFPDPSYSQRNAASLTGERRAWAA